MVVLLLALRIARYLAVLVAFYGAIFLWFTMEGYMALRIVGGIVVFLTGITLALILAIWSGNLASDYAPDDEGRRYFLITGKLPPPGTPRRR